ncbi:hypothetical protein AGDE_05466 [Angomonas deanei]|uniref:Selenoprotein SelK_SelG, putative n=1 Tax=Angomonas deanei TaxID=59799 RepID=A0A7G2C0H0_9TRYP|nr:hypothetical protein AGDE_05466 [Angomonas deanei]CAD2213230.1 Selenoprotein SelK_SelG, putative [Angomonas deanei]|eukprot:EPY38463.1 hypothetical protein AGDE_05466 [Angomonas deanei]
MVDSSFCFGLNTLFTSPSFLSFSLFYKKMAYIVDGKVVEKKPFSIIDFLVGIALLIVFFFHTLISPRPLAEEVQDFRAQQRSNSNPSAQLRRLFQPRRTPGGGELGFGHGRNIHTLASTRPPPGCKTGG